MTRKTYLLGISIAALAAGTASAQTANSDNILCGPTNVCTVDNDVPGNDRNTGTIRVQGRDNLVSIVQRGDDNDAGADIVGDDNDAYLFQDGDDHVSRYFGNGNENRADILQATEANDATIRQTGDLNQSYIYQGRTSGTVNATVAGENNVATSIQTGINHRSFISQRANLNGISADNNAITVNQSGNGNYSEVFQVGSGNTGIVTMLDGGPIATGSFGPNTSILTQFNNNMVGTAGGGFAAGAPSASNNPDSGNLADIAIRGQQNDSRVTQNGVQLTAIVSILNGGGGNTGSTPPAGPDGTALPSNRIQGNYSFIRQDGRGHMVEISSGGSALFNGQGNRSDVRQNGQVAAGHSALVYQRGILENVVINQSTNALGGAGGTSTQSGSIADVSQLSINSEATITQVGTNTANVTQGRNADRTGGDNLVFIDQTDAGDTVTNPTDPFGGGGSVVAARNTADVAQYGISNFIDIDQNARNARATVFQTQASLDNNATINQSGGQPSLNLTASITQAGTRSNATVNQSGQNNTASVAQTGTVYAAGVVPNSASVTQASNWNTANVTQNGNRLTATVNQQGTGTSARPNLVTITQTTNSNFASALQQAGTGPSGATAPAAGIAGNAAFPNARPAGAASAEIRITQSNTGNTAIVSQAGLGQYGEINQSGQNNSGRITQDAGATNAVAIIEQSGNTNTYTITQSQPGQYFRVTQTGNANATTNNVTSGPGGGGTGTATFTP